MLTFKKIVVLACIGIGSASLGQLSFADENTEIKPLALRKIMQELGKNMQVVTDGISREDWELVAKTAPLIADHPQPTAIEKLRILNFIGSDVGKFKAYDEKSHQDAQQLQQAATRKDGSAVISTFSNLQNSCLGCHQSFRKGFKEYFYEKR